MRVIIKNNKELQLSGRKDHYFKSDGVFVLLHGCVVSKFPQFYDRNLKINIYLVHMW